MQKTKVTLAAAAFVATLPFLQGCVPAVIVGGVAAGAVSIHDRRSTGVQTDDESTEWKASLSVPKQYKEYTHANFTSFNRRVLITGETSNDEAKAAIEAEVRKIEGVRDVYNGLGIGPMSSLGSRSTDAYISSKVKARLVDSNQLSANHIKVFTERAIVYLMGIVTEREAKVAVAVARTTAGVVKVVNAMEVQSDEEVRRIDEHTFGSRSTPPQSAPVENR